MTVISHLKLVIPPLIEIESLDYLDISQLTLHGTYESTPKITILNDPCSGCL
jgi:hypothetical protein